jgi:hypothetical protein
MAVEDPVAVCCFVLGMTIVFLKLSTRVLLYLDRHLHSKSKGA